MRSFLTITIFFLSTAALVDASLLRTEHSDKKVRTDEHKEQLRALQQGSLGPCGISAELSAMWKIADEDCIAAIENKAELVSCVTLENACPLGCPDGTECFMTPSYPPQTQCAESLESLATSSGLSVDVLKPICAPVVLVADEETMIGVP